MVQRVQVNGPAFNNTFNTPGPVIQGFIVACYDRELILIHVQAVVTKAFLAKSEPSWVQSRLLRLENGLDAV